MSFTRFNAARATESCCQVRPACVRASSIEGPSPGLMW